MTFNLANLSAVGSAELLNDHGQPFQRWDYSTSDALSVVKTGGYFIPGMCSTDPLKPLAGGDLVAVTASDGLILVMLTENGGQMPLAGNSSGPMAFWSLA